jgi:hypothetical protein
MAPSRDTRAIDRLPLVRQPGTARPPDWGTISEIRLSQGSNSGRWGPWGAPLRSQLLSYAHIIDIVRLLSRFMHTMACATSTIGKLIAVFVQRNWIPVLRVIECDGIPPLHFHVCMEQCCLQLYIQYIKSSGPCALG